EQVSKICTVREESAGCHKFSNSVKRRQLQPRSEFRNAHCITSGERVFDGNECIQTQSSRSIECAIEIVRASHLQGLDFYPQCPPPGLCFFEDERGIRIGRIPKHCHAREARQKLFQQFESLRTQVRHHEAHSRDVAAGS